MKYIIVDLDGTLCDDAHRAPHASAGDWDMYFSKMCDDPIHTDVKYLLHMLCDTVKIVLLTSRQEQYRTVTQEHLRRNEIPYQYLLMRANNDLSDSGDSKLFQLEYFFGDRETVLKSVLFALDDRDKIVRAFREYGIPCWQVRPEKIFGTEYVKADEMSAGGVR